MASRPLALLLLCLAPFSPGRSEELVLAISWEPAFCETSPEVEECRTQTPGRYDASHFSLHGLWPQPRSNVYCQVPERLAKLQHPLQWSGLPAVELEPDTRRELARVMPGETSGLDRHEWWKHGTCYQGRSAERYYRDSLLLMQRINRSRLRTLFALRRGRQVSGVEIRNMLEQSFGPGVGSRVRISCYQDGDRLLVGELLLSFLGPVTEGLDLGAAMRAAPEMDPGCEGGLVDRSGLQ